MLLDTTTEATEIACRLTPDQLEAVEAWAWTTYPVEMTDDVRALVHACINERMRRNDIDTEAYMAAWCRAEGPAMVAGRHADIEARRQRLLAFEAYDRAR